MSLSVEVLNTIRNNADTLYQDRVPQATKDNIAEIGRVFEQYDLVYNEFINSLIHKIGLTLLQTKSFENRLKAFKSGTIMSEQDIEEIWVDQFRKAEGTYDKNGGMGEGGINPFKRRDYNDVKVMYHRMNRQDKYTITITKVDVIRAFRSANTLDAFLTAQFNSIYTGSEYDEFIHMKKLLSEGIAKGDFYNYDCEGLDGSLEKSKQLIRTMKKAVKDLTLEPSKLYNSAGVMTISDVSELVLFVNKDVSVHLDVDFYSQVFGPDYAKMKIKVIELANFGDDDKGTFALLCDKDWFKVYDTLRAFKQLENPEGLYTNYWLHVWQIMSYSKFKNAVRFGLPISA